MRNLKELNEILEADGDEPTTLDECEAFDVDLTWPEPSRVERLRRAAVRTVLPVGGDLIRDMARGK